MSWPVGWPCWCSHGNTHARAHRHELLSLVIPPVSACEHTQRKLDGMVGAVGVGWIKLQWRHGDTRATDNCLLPHAATVGKRNIAVWIVYGRAGDETCPVGAD
eukprot:5861317-Amphidinium_carterae.1